MRCFSGALADSKPEREAWPGAAPGTSQAAVRLPSLALGNQVQTVPSVKHSLSIFPSPKHCSRWKPNTKGS